MITCLYCTSSNRRGHCVPLVQGEDADARKRIGAYERRSRRCLLSLLLLAAAMLSVGWSASPVMADAAPAPTPERPYVVFLPVVVNLDAPPQPVTVIFQQGRDNYVGAVETFISSYNPYAAHGYDPIVAVRWDRALVADVEAGLSRWDLTSIPTAAAVQTATLGVYIADRTNVNPMTLSAYRVLRPWLFPEANWYSATVATAWAAPGCNGIDSDRRGLAASSADVSSIGVWIELPVTALVQHWVSDPSTNYGIVLKPTGTSATSSVRYEIASSLYPELWRRPILSVTYVLPPGGGNATQCVSDTACDR